MQKVFWDNPYQTVCRGKIVMSALGKVKMSAFTDREAGFNFEYESEDMAYEPRRNRKNCCDREYRC